MELPEFLWHCSRDSEVIGSDILEVYLASCHVEETPLIIAKMTDFWRLIFPSITLSLATVCDTLTTIRENHWWLRLI